MPDVFTPEELEQIREAVSRAEERTAGEIVPVIVAASDRYHVAVWKGAAIAALAALAFALLFFRFYDGWGWGWLHTGWGTAFLTLSLGIAGALIGAFVPAAKRQLAGQSEITRAVHRRAVKAFLDEEVFATRDRTGILIFISMLERRIEVLGDAGINEKVAPEEWADVVEHISLGIKRGRIADGIIAAIEDCGKLLERRGVEIKADDTNELPDTIRLRKGH